VQVAGDAIIEKPKRSSRLFDPEFPTPIERRITAISPTMISETPRSATGEIRGSWHDHFVLRDLDADQSDRDRAVRHNRRRYDCR
jgi:hypothetical protein